MKQTSEELWQLKNGGKHSKDATKDSELITPTYAVLLMEEHASNELASYKAELRERLELDFHKTMNVRWEESNFFFKNGVNPEAFRIGQQAAKTYFKALLEDNPTEK